MTRQGAPLGRRTVAGRIIKESYGSVRQQHTFTVEVLWSRGTKKLDPLFPLLVKGRNLYKLKTFRQHWNNERDRLEVLAEKHIRGAAARSVRNLRKRKAETKTNKAQTYKGTKRRKHSHLIGPSGIKQTTCAEKNYGNEALAGKKKKCPSRNLTLFRPLNSEHGDLRGSRQQNLIQSNRVREQPFFPCNYPPQNFSHFKSDVIQRGSTSMARLPYYDPIPNSAPRPASECQNFSHGRFIDPSFLPLHTMVNHNPAQGNFSTLSMASGRPTPHRDYLPDSVPWFACPDASYLHSGHAYEARKFNQFPWVNGQ